MESTANGSPQRPLPGTKNRQGWGIVPHPAEAEPHANSVQVPGSLHILTLAHGRTCRLPSQPMSTRGLWLVAKHKFFFGGLSNFRILPKKFWDY